LFGEFFHNKSSDERLSLHERRAQRAAPLRLL
jgi:hypothetical protein